jgi:hypothetical protein
MNCTRSEVMIQESVSGFRLEHGRAEVAIRQDTVVRRPKETINAQLEAWISGIVQSNEAPVAALERLRDSYTAMIAGGSVTDDSKEIKDKVDEALRNADKATKRSLGPTLVAARLSPVFN